MPNKELQEELKKYPDDSVIETYAISTNKEGNYNGGAISLRLVGAPLRRRLFVGWAGGL